MRLVAAALAPRRPGSWVDGVIGQGANHHGGSAQGSLLGAFGDLQVVAQMLVVVVGQIVHGDLVAAGMPNTVMAADVIQNFAQMADVMRLSDLIGVQGDAKDPPAVGALGVQAVEGGLAGIDEVTPAIGPPVPQRRVV